MSLRRRVMGQSSGGIRKAEGTVTLSANGTLTIQHDLGTAKVAGLVFPAEPMTFSQGYLKFYAEFMNASALSGDPQWTLDFSSYNKHQSGAVTVDLPSSRLRVGIAHASPWETQKDWYEAYNSMDMVASGFTFAENNVSIGYTFGKGSYRYIIWALE